MQWAASTIHNYEQGNISKPLGGDKNFRTPIYKNKSSYKNKFRNNFCIFAMRNISQIILIWARYERGKKFETRKLFNFTIYNLWLLIGTLYCLGKYQCPGLTNEQRMKLHLLPQDMPPYCNRELQAQGSAHFHGLARVWHNIVIVTRRWSYWRPPVSKHQDYAISQISNFPGIYPRR